MVVLAGGFYSGGGSFSGFEMKAGSAGFFLQLSG